MIRPPARNQWFLKCDKIVTNTQSKYIRLWCLGSLKIRFFFEFLQTDSDRFVCRLVVIVVPRVFYCYCQVHNHVIILLLIKHPQPSLGETSSLSSSSSSSSPSGRRLFSRHQIIIIRTRLLYYYRSLRRTSLKIEIIR